MAFSVKSLGPEVQYTDGFAQSAQHLLVLSSVNPGPCTTFSVIVTTVKSQH